MKKKEYRETVIYISTETFRKWMTRGIIELLIVKCKQGHSNMMEREKYINGDKNVNSEHTREKWNQHCRMRRSLACGNYSS